MGLNVKNKEVKNVFMTNILYKEEAYNIVGACFEVYNELGCGFLEPVYQESLEYELTDRNIAFISQNELNITFKKRTLKQKYIPDFICYDKIIVEIKAVKELNDIHRAQVFNYLKATGMKLGLLINFGNYPNLEHERIVN